MSMVAAAAATATCPGRFWGPPESVTPSPPRHFTFEPLPAPKGPPKPRRRHRRVLYPPVVRRPLPSEEPSAAKRLLLLLLAVVGTQIYNAPGDLGTPEGTGTPVGTPPVPPNIPEAPQIPAGNVGTAGTPNGTAPGAPMGGSCPSGVVAPPLSPPFGIVSHPSGPTPPSSAN